MLDRIDCALVEALQDDARQTVKELAARVGLSPSATHARVQRLTERGVITAFRAEVDPAAVGVGLQALIAVHLRRHAAGSLSSFREHALSLPEVVTVTHVTGAVDFLIHVGVRDVDHLRAFAVDHITTREEVERIETSVVYEHVRSHAWPVYTGG